MRNALLPTIAAVSLFLTGVFILNTQLWFSSRAESLSGAQYAAKSINLILDEAARATQTAMNIAATGCDLDGQYRLGIDAALEPHLRTVVIIKRGAVWCSSLPGNRIMLSTVPPLSASHLLLAPAVDMANGQPVLIYNTQFDDSHILVIISDRHIRSALSVPLKGVNYALRVNDAAIGVSDDVTALAGNLTYNAQVNSAKYPFSIVYRQPPLWSLQRLIAHGLGILLFLLFISIVTAYVLNKYLNKDVTPEERLRRAIRRGEIVPFYHMVVNGREGTLRGVEVLARWKHPRAGYLSPASFIPLAEKTGLIVSLTQSLMAQVVANMNAIAVKLPEGFHVGINFSASHISRPDFVDECLRFKESFLRQDLNLVLEVTEREPLHVDEALIQTLNTLHKVGFVIALDDFGTGYSGLSYLHDLHIDYIKIDQSFVARVNEDPDSTRILDCVLDLARKLSLSIVAEGVETKAQLDYLNKNEITFQQGYYFYKPVKFTEFVKILLSKPKVKVNVE